MFLKNKNIIFKIRRSKVTDYAALTKQGKMTIYNSFIVFNFNYCPLAWHFCSTSSTNKLEKSREGFTFHQQ